MGIENGFKVRLCFDPMIYTPDFKTVYKNVLRLKKQLRELLGERQYDKREDKGY